MPKVIIEVEGGCITEIHSDDPDLVVDIYDWDNIKQGDMTDEEIEAMESRFVEDVQNTGVVY